VSIEEHTSLATIVGQKAPITAGDTASTGV